MSQPYIEAARKKFGHRGNFICKKLDEQVVSNMNPFDSVLAIGVLHHLNDDEALQLFKVAYTALKPGGRLITVDPVFYEGQANLERFFISKDRGQYLRFNHDYRRLVPDYFGSVKESIRSGLLYMPSSLMVMECSK
jgi:cyclopropane fatty-acyl-phospholipid synthase-like methyltransferase